MTPEPSAPESRTSPLVAHPPVPAPPLTELHVRRLGPVGRLLERRPRLGDAVVMTVFAGWALLMGVGADSMYVLHVHLGGDRVQLMQVASLALTAAGTTALAWRRQRPLVVAAVMAVLGLAALAATGAVSGFELGLALALYAVAAARQPLATWAVVVATVTVLLVGARLLPLARTVGEIVAGLGPEAPGPFLQSASWQQTALPVVVLALLAVAAGTSARNRRLHAARVVEAAAAVAREHEQRAQLARATERTRIAREMHDVVAHSISVMVALGGGASVALDRAPDQARTALDELTATGRSALADMRRVLGVLDEAALADAGPGAAVPDGAGAGTGTRAPVAPMPGVADLATLVDRARLAGLRIESTDLADQRLTALDAGLQLAVHRIAQEALTNALRYAPGSEVVALAVRPSSDRVEVVVTDSGATLPVEPGRGSGRGLLGMRERAAALGGTVEAGPHEGGWRVRAVLPVPEGSAGSGSCSGVRSDSDSDSDSDSEPGSGRAADRREETT